MESEDDKPVIFVSHAAADSQIANAFRSDVEESFLGMCRLFVSSNLDSLKGGKEWMQEIRVNLSVAKISIGLPSPFALTRPWIYTEFGAGWIREIPTISVCHSGLEKSQLPVPLSHFQALNLTDERHLRHLFKLISSAIGCECPTRDFPADVTRYLEITEMVRTTRLFREWISQLMAWNSDFSKIFDGETVEILVQGEADLAFRGFVADAERMNYLKIDSRGIAMGTAVGMHASVWGVAPGKNIEEFKTFATIDIPDGS